MLDVVWIEHLTAQAYFEGETDTFQYQLMFDAVTESSLEPGASMDLIKSHGRPGHDAQLPAVSAIRLDHVA